MKNSFAWVVIKFIFGFVKFRDILKTKNKEEINYFLSSAIEEENYELAAYLKYYLEFKMKGDIDKIAKNVN